jgi:hypothetical protein
VWYNTTTSFSETALANFGNGKFAAFMRNDLAGTLTGYESSDYCVTWTPRVPSNLLWWGGGGPEIPNVYHEPDGTVTVFYECRDSKYMSISRNNNVSSNFGTTIYQTPEMFSYNNGAGGNPSLGYGAMRMVNGNQYVLIYAFEESNAVAHLMYTRTDLVTDPNGVPIPPPSVDTTSISTTSFRFDINGYTQAQLDNIRYFSFDISTVSDFSSFASLKYQTPTLAPASTMQNIRQLAQWDVFNSAITATRYWIRVKACNNAGCSAYSTASVTTQ